MIIFASSRQSGKTTALVEIFRCDPKRFLVVMTGQERERIIHQYNLTAEEAGRVLLAGGLPHNLRALEHIDRAHLYVDNAEIILAHLLGGTYIAGMSMTVDAVRVNGVPTEKPKEIP